MKRYLIVCWVILLFVAATAAHAQNTGGENTVKPIPRNYLVIHALEVESLFPMFFWGGYHAAIGYRYKNFRLRASVINGGSYNAEPAGLINEKANFKRFYKTSPGFFLGYNVWKNLEVYGFVELHRFAIEQKATGYRQNIRSNDFGGGISYQFFLGHYVYLQPGLHLYLRNGKSRDFGGVEYKIPTADLSPVLRFGVRLWSKYN